MNPSLLVIVLPSTLVIVSPGTRPALAAGEPANHSVRSAARAAASGDLGAAVCRSTYDETDADVGVLDLLAGDDRVRDLNVGVAGRGEADAGAVAELVWIWSLRPSTWPLASSSGRPELPGLIAASVWIARGSCSCWAPVMLRPTALTMPAVVVSGRPNGLPIATTGSPTWASDELANLIGCSSEALVFCTLITATSVDGSVPSTLAGR